MIKVSEAENPLESLIVTDKDFEMIIDGINEARELQILDEETIDETVVVTFDSEATYAMIPVNMLNGDVTDYTDGFIRENYLILRLAKPTDHIIKYYHYAGTAWHYLPEIEGIIKNEYLVPNPGCKEFAPMHPIVPAILVAPPRHFDIVQDGVYIFNNDLLWHEYAHIEEMKLWSWFENDGSAFPQATSLSTFLSYVNTQLATLGVEAISSTFITRRYIGELYAEFVSWYKQHLLNVASLVINPDAIKRLNTNGNEHHRARTIVILLAKSGISFDEFKSFIHDLLIDKSM